MVSRAGCRPVGVLVLRACHTGVTVIAQSISSSLVTISSRFDTMKAEAEGMHLHWERSIWCGLKKVKCFYFVETMQNSDAQS